MQLLHINKDHLKKLSEIGIYLNNFFKSHNTLCNLCFFSLQRLPAGATSQNEKDRKVPLFSEAIKANQIRGQNNVCTLLKVAINSQFWTTLLVFPISRRQ